MQNTLERKEIVNYKDLIVWQKAVAFSVKMYKATGKFPKSELYALVSQLRRAAVSISSNIAEGHTRQHTGEFIQFLHIALGSSSEVETQLMIARELNYLCGSEYAELIDGLQEIRKMLNGLVGSLKRKVRC